MSGEVNNGTDDRNYNGNNTFKNIINDGGMRGNYTDARLSAMPISIPGLTSLELLASLDDDREVTAALHNNPV